MKSNASSAHVISIISLAFSFAALCLCVKLSRFRCGTTVSDVIAVLTILVTVLIGFQIYNIINLEKRLEKLQHEMEEYMYKYGFSVAGVTLADVGSSNAIQQDWLVAAKLLLNALMYYNEGVVADEHFDEVATLTAQNLFYVISDAKKQRKDIRFSITDITRAKYILAIERFASEDIRVPLISFINTLPRITE